jgi:ATP-dependent Zn protease
MHADLNSFSMISSHLADEDATAYHEAGHAVVGAVRGRAPIFVTIIRDGCAYGKNEFPEDWPPEFKNHFGDSPEKRAYIETRILTSVAGTVAHDLRFPDRAHDAGDAYDERSARAIIEDHAGWADSDRDSYFQQLQETARSILQTNWHWVEAVVRALIERKTIFTAEVMKTLYIVHFRSLTSSAKRSLATKS